MKNVKLMTLFFLCRNGTLEVCLLFLSSSSYLLSWFQYTQVNPSFTWNPNDGREKDDVNSECKTLAWEKLSCLSLVGSKESWKIWGEQTFKFISSPFRTRFWRWHNRKQLNHNLSCRSPVGFTPTGPELESWWHRRRRWCLLWMHNQSKSSDLQSYLETKCKYLEIPRNVLNISKKRKTLKFKTSSINPFILPLLRVDSRAIVFFHDIWYMENDMCKLWKALLRLFFFPSSFQSPGKQETRYIFYVLLFLHNALDRAF